VCRSWRAIFQKKRPKSQLTVGLFLSQIANDWQLVALAVKGSDKHDKPDNEDGEADQFQNHVGGEPNGRYDILNHPDENVDNRPGNEKEDRLPRVEANKLASLEGFNDEEHNCRNDRDVGNARCCVVREARWIRIGHAISLGVEMKLLEWALSAQSAPLKIVNEAGRINPIIIAQAIRVHCSRSQTKLDPIQ